MTISELIEDDYAYLKDVWTREAAAAQIEAVNYLIFISSSTHADISDWDILKVFGEDANAVPIRIVTDKTELNRRLFAKAENRELPERKEEIQLSPEDLKYLNAALGESIDLAFRNRGHMLTRARDLVRSLQSQLNTAIQSLANLAGNAVPSDKAKVDILEQIKAVEALGFAVFHDMDVDSDDWSPCVRFLARSEIVLRYENSHQGLNITHNFGRFILSLNLKRRAVYLVPYENNKAVDDYYHPHSSVDGQICLGSGAVTVAEAFGRADLKTVAAVAWAVVTNYNPESPYVSIQNFVNISEGDSEEEDEPETFQPDRVPSNVFPSQIPPRRPGPTGYITRTLNYTDAVIRGRPETAPPRVNIDYQAASRTEGIIDFVRNIPSSRGLEQEARYHARAGLIPLTAVDQLQEIWALGRGQGRDEDSILSEQRAALIGYLTQGTGVWS